MIHNFKKSDWFPQGKEGDYTQQDVVQFYRFNTSLVIADNLFENIHFNVTDMVSAEVFGDANRPPWGAVLLRDRVMIASAILYFHTLKTSSEEPCQGPLCGELPYQVAQLEEPRWEERLYEYKHLTVTGNVFTNISVFDGRPLFMANAWQNF